MSSSFALLARRAGSLAAFTAFFVTNPALFTACSSEQGFEFGEAEMLESLDAVNAQTYEFEGYLLTLDLSQAREGKTASLREKRGSSRITSAHACGERTFVKSASACMDVTTMPIEGTLKLVHAATGVTRLEADAHGNFRVLGNTLAAREVSLTFDGGQLELGSPNDDDRDGPMVLWNFRADGAAADGSDVIYPKEDPRGDLGPGGSSSE